MFNYFEKLIKKQDINENSRKFVPILFQIFLENNLAYLKILDEKTKETTNTNYKYYQGNIREVLKICEEIKEKSSYNFNWLENNSICLSEHSSLIESLKSCTNIVNNNFEKLTFEKEIKTIYLSLEEHENKITSKFFLNDNISSGFTIIHPDYVISENKLYSFSYSVNNFEKLVLFEASFPKNKLEEFLALFFGYFEFFTINYGFENYEIIQNEQKTTRQTLIFEKIDELNNLYIRISESISNIEPDFIENYNPDKIAIVNKLDKKIFIHELERIDIYPIINEFSKSLSKYKKELKEKNNFYYEENLFIIEEELAILLVHKELSNILSQFIVYGAEKLKEYNIRTVDPKLRLSLTHNLGFFDGMVSLEIDGQVISLFDAINFYKKNSYIKLNDGTTAIINKSYIEKLERILKKSKNNVRFSFFDIPIIEDLVDEATYQENFKQYKEMFLGFNNLNESKLEIPYINAKLRNYQEKGYKWLKYLYENNLGGCLADDMGLGKTIQTITLLSSIYPGEEKPSLIVMPKSLLYNWENEIEKFNPGLSYYIYYAQAKDLRKAMTKNIILTTYSILRNEIEKFKNEDFHYIILDESQNIKNIQSQISKAVVLLKAKHRLALSGTPIENNLSELYALFRFLNPMMFSSFDDFYDHYMNPIQKDNNIEVTNELRKKIYPFILRRLKKDVLEDLPPKIEQTLYVEMTDEQCKLYEQRRAFYYKNLKTQIAVEGINKAQFIILQALNELRQIASVPEVKTDGTVISAKRELLLEYVNEVISLGHKILIFTNYLGSVEYISEDLEKAGISHLIMTGATQKRQELVDEFQNNEKNKVFLMTLKTGGLGLNLTKADYVFIYDPWWNKSVENQAIDRTHRIGQDKTVFSYKLITKNTIEEKILKLQELKTDLFNKIISSDDASIKSLTEEDIDFILGE